LEERGGGTVLFTLALLLLLAWLIGLAFKVTFWLIHLLLVAALVLFAVGFVRGRVGPRPRRTVP
jgi:Flp pilus assembly protein TadB